MDFNKKICDVCKYDKWDFKPQISSIFNFEYVNEVWIRGVLGVRTIWEEQQATYTQYLPRPGRKEAKE